MTVEEAINYLQNIEDKDVMLMIDCSYCGHGNQLVKIVEAVILCSEESK